MGVCVKWNKTTGNLFGKNLLGGNPKQTKIYDDNDNDDEKNVTITIQP